MATLLVSLLAFATVTLVTYLAYLLLTRYADRGNKAKERRLQEIRRALHASGAGSGAVDDGLEGGAAERWLQEHVQRYGRFEALVRRARSPLSAWRWLTIMLALFGAVLVLGLLRSMALPMLVILALAAAGVPLLWLLSEAGKRSKAFNEKFPETLDHITRALRAGHSLTSALATVGREFPGPVGEEFKTLSDEIGFGLSFREAVGRLAERMPGSDLNFFAVSITIQHETGGNLAELLDGLAKTIRKRIKLRGKVRILTAEGRISAWVLGIMPFAMMGILLMINPDYISLLWTTSLGSNLMLAGAGLMVLGFFVLSRIVQLKV